tara:strand:+ start:31 stop:396 length:366 start_codon:yes stop_codon:yes gene_type:complete
MSIWSTLTGGGDVISKGFGLIDSLHTSETELIEAKTKSKTDLLSSYAPFKVAQRYLALIFSFTFVSSYFLVLVMVLMGKSAKDVFEVIEVFKIGWIMLTIIGFYFGGGAFEGILEKRKEKK